MAETELRLLIDSNEPAGLRLKLQTLLPPEALAVRRLKFGDYHLLGTSYSTGTVLIVERKTISDFLASVGDGRLDKQVEGCTAESGGNAVLLLEGGYGITPKGLVVIGHRTTGWSAKAFAAKLLALQRRHECRILTSPNSTTTAQLIAILARTTTGHGPTTTSAALPTT